MDGQHPADPLDETHRYDAARSEELRDMYRNRFEDLDRQRIGAVWDLLYERFLSRYVPRAGAVLDLGAGSCVFINRAQAARRIAVDLNPDVRENAAAGVEVLLTPSADLSAVDDASIDLVFTSNFFEHLRSPEELRATLSECHRTLRPGGLIVVLMPNLRAVGARYFDYVDHTLPLTDRSLAEALSLCGFRVTEVVPRFIPYGANPAGRPQPEPGARPGILADPAVHRRLFSAYLRLRPAWWVFGGQMLVVAERA